MSETQEPFVGERPPPKPVRSPLDLALELYWANESPRAEGPLTQLIELLKNPWLAIETAPKDGTGILVTDGDWVGEVSWMVRWYNDKTNQGWMIANCDEEYGHYVVPTHWMPLPAPPEAA